MKIKVKRVFRYQIDSRKEGVIEPGVHDLPEELALKVLRFGKAEKVVEKKAPENKVVKVSENKSKVAGKPLRRSRTRPKPVE
jgi:hypothetical protein